MKKEKHTPKSVYMYRYFSRATCLTLLICYETQNMLNLVLGHSEDSPSHSPWGMSVFQANGELGNLLLLEKNGQSSFSQKHTSFNKTLTDKIFPYPQWNDQLILERDTKPTQYVPFFKK